MKLGSHLMQARKGTGLSQEAVAEKLGVSRQTISKWETDETLPDIRQAKRLAVLYGVTLDKLVEFDEEVEALQETILRTREEVSEQIDWTKLWSQKYPILSQYQGEVAVTYYAETLEQLLRSLEETYGYDPLNAFLVLKDILASRWKDREA